MGLRLYNSGIEELRNCELKDLVTLVGNDTRPVK